MREGWEIKKLGEICTLFTDGDWIESKDQSDAGIRLIQTGNVGCGIFNDKAEHYRYISQNTFDRLKCTEIYAGDILISRLPDPIGRSCIIPYLPDRMITAVDCTIVRLGDDLIPPFLVHYTNSSDYNKKIQRYVTGAVRKRISRKNLSQIEIPIPPLSEQKRIVAELDLLSEVIVKKREQLTQLDALAQSIFYDMFGDPITNEKGWRKEKITKIAPIEPYQGDVSGINGMYWLLNLDMIQSNKCTIHEKVYVQYDEVGTSTIKFNKDNVLYSKLRPYLNKVVIPNDSGYCTSELVPFKPFENIILKIFLCYVLSHKSFVNYISSKVIGAKMPRVSMDALREFNVITPPLSLQQQFTSKIEAIEKQKELIKQSLSEVQQLFDSRMDYFFNN